MTAALDDLVRVPLFAGMTERAREAVADLAAEVTFEPGDAQIVEGADDCAFYLLVEGEVEVRRGGALVRRLGAGDFIGEISLIDGRPRTATVTAVGRVRTLMIERDGFLALVDRHAAVRLGILMALTDRVRTDERLAVDLA
jgi:CRP-like cAMP-binding protein